MVGRLREGAVINNAWDLQLFIASWCNRHAVARAPTLIMEKENSFVIEVAFDLNRLSRDLFEEWYKK